jgi:hypothetical protein
VSVDSVLRRLNAAHNKAVSDRDVAQRELVDAQRSVVDNDDAADDDAAAAAEASSRFVFFQRTRDVVVDTLACLSEKAPIVAVGTARSFFEVFFSSAKYSCNV